ncbi:hypothetical protein [Salinicola rhizosphaerae]|uniref:Uncharacterized protein n=1 Tax=Salinicola rhizosphaerae TaxID=1443141 RepID=A0ABQ3EFI5_9GAMM|nr:hypothetical protein [Salinicola rhizosphaerae]GHB30801.1 hypothetical protein GCM10009038_32020 [Salinicola rhizosphaerae]
MSQKHTLIATLAGAIGFGEGWKRKPAKPEVDAAPIRPYRAERPPVDGRSRKAAAEERRARRQAKRAENARRQQHGEVRRKRGIED